MRVGLTVGVTITLLTCPDVAADPTHVQTTQPRLLCVPPAPSERCRDLPPGRFVDEATWSRLDTELRRAQDSETRLRAENNSLRKSVSAWSPGWKIAVTTFLVGVTGGLYLHAKL